MGWDKNVKHTDYLIVGAGAVGLAFADTILAETDATLTIVDRNAKPGGHWNDAYSFVQLHQPSAFYGVSSVPLGQNRKDTTGHNAGYYELATGAEVLAYFDHVIQDHFLPTGRVRYMPNCDYRSNGEIIALDTGEQINLKAGKVVDATYYGTTIPATHTPKFDIADGTNLAPPNALPALLRDTAQQADRYVLLGAGKTAMDAGVWLIEAGVDPDKISWVMPRDSWLWNRHHTQPSLEFFKESFGGQAAMLAASAQASDPHDIFARLEAEGVMLRIDPEHLPEMYHCATMSRGEVEVLRKIKHVLRQGRVQAINPAGMTFASGRVALEGKVQFIDCTATAVERRPALPVFDGDKITLQMLRICQPTFSAALIAFIEANIATEAEKNQIASVVPLPDTVEDYVPVTVANMMNQFAWSQNPQIREWLATCRLDGFASVLRQVDKDDAEKQAILKAFKSHGMPAFANLQAMMAAASANA